MKTLNTWLEEYGVSHKNPTNILIHKFCVPFIMLSVLGLLWNIKILGVSLILILSALALVFYFMLGVKPFLVMLTQVLLMVAIISYINIATWGYAVIFIIAWIFQFIGHKIEGKKPSFLEDLQFLLIGPLWILKSVFFK